MSSIPAKLRRLVVDRAGSRCEYCGLSQDGQEATFHIDHIIPRIADGPTSEDNLALACVSCSLRKEARQDVISSITGQRVSLFHPRCQRWAEHFAWDDVRVVGLTETGIATISVLGMNRPLILAIRREEAIRGRHPPPMM